MEIKEKLARELNEVWLDSDKNDAWLEVAEYVLKKMDEALPSEEAIAEILKNNDVYIKLRTRNEFINHEGTLFAIAQAILQLLKGKMR